MNYTELIAQRQSCRNFDKTQKVAKSDIEKILKNAMLAPSACNSQPWKFTVVMGEKVCEIAAATQSMGMNKFTQEVSVFIVISEGAYNTLSADKFVSVESNSVLTIDLSESLTDSPKVDPLSQIDFATMEMLPSVTLLQALSAIEAAATDDKIEAILLRPSSLSTVSTSALEELREALKVFKTSGKPIIAYNDTYSQSGYYFASVADKIYVQPEGMILWQGMGTSTMFYKGLLDKLDISVEIFRPTACKYKSAVEPYFLSKMSPENRAQMEELISSMWSVVASEVAAARSLSIEQVNAIASSLTCLDVEAALEAGMIDGLAYEDQIPELLRKAGAEVSDDLTEVLLSEYVATNGAMKQRIGADKVAIIYAEGSIVDGDGVDAKVYGDSTAELIDKARLDDDIKAVVLRVNSPGGSALASDVMWRALTLLREEKPLIVSMGSYAASGGYYISAPADVIIADRTTLTGSIGVFGMFPNIEKGLKNKLGITFDGVETNSSANFGRTFGAITPFERAVMIKNVDKVYTRFTSLVSEGRNLPLEDVLEIAQGRVWSGEQAVELGLVDSIGGLKEAIQIAVQKAGLDQFRVVEVTAEPVGLAALFSTTTVAVVKNMLGIDALNLDFEYEQIRNALEPMTSKSGMVMYSPYSVSL